MKEKTCCFTGHKKIPFRKSIILYKVLKSVITSLIEHGYERFCSGGAMGFDTIAALAVLRLRHHYPDIKLILILPCLSQNEKRKIINKLIYRIIKSKADEIIYTSTDYFPGCMQKRNRHLVDCSSVCVCYSHEETGDTAYTVKYARKNGLKIYHL